MSTRIAATVIVLAGIAAAMGGWLLASRPMLGPAAQGNTNLASLELPVFAPEGSATKATDGPAQRGGDVVVLDFWASWCSPCHVQSRLLGAMVSDYSERGVHFFAINVGESDAIVAQSLEEHPIAFPVLMDRDGASSGAAQVFGLPTLVVIDRDGSVALRRVGLTSARFLRDTLDELLASGGLAGVGG